MSGSDLHHAKHDEDGSRLSIASPCDFREATHAFFPVAGVIHRTGNKLRTGDPACVVRE
jgi:hypothetical protein